VTSERTCVLRVDDAINKSISKSSDRSGPNQRHYWEAFALIAASLRARQVEYRVGQHPTTTRRARMWSATAVCDEEDSTDGYGVQRCDQTVDYCAGIPTPEPVLQSAICNEHASGTAPARDLHTVPPRLRKAHMAGPITLRDRNPAWSRTAK
jgi:hypothetical protein